MKRFLQRIGLRKRHRVFPDARSHTIRVRSSKDGARQSCLFFPAKGDTPRPLLVYLHPWRHHFDFDSQRWQAQAASRNWHYLAPDFRGPNRRPEACGSALARQDVIDAVDHVCANHAIDPARNYLAGTSGGGHMALVMATEAPGRWAAVSVWCPISDLIAWHAEAVRVGAKVHRHIEKVAGGPPGSSERVDEELRYRSPRFHMAKAAGTPLDINHGVHDVAVDMRQAVWAFNALAEAEGAEPVAEGGLDGLRDAAIADETYGRKIYLRQSAGPSRITLYDGLHEDLPAAAVAWLENHARRSAD